MKRIIFSISAVLFIQLAVFSQIVGTYLDSRDGKVYKTITIGSQTWMSENLNYVTESGSWCYNESHAACDQFGRLYNFETAQNVCMNGWKLPEKQDFDILVEFVTKQGSVFDMLAKDGKSGFNALMSGWRGLNENYYAQGTQERFWTSSDWQNMNAWFFSMDAATNLSKTDTDNRNLGFSVRCIRIPQTKE